MSSRHVRFVALAERLRREFPEVHDPIGWIDAGHVLVDGVVVANPRSLVSRHARITLTSGRLLRGTVKLRAALGAFGISAQGCVAADIGASTGGFTIALLEAGATRVYAIDAGYGQLLGSLRQDRRVVNLERTNLGTLGPNTVPEPVNLVTIDISYLALADAVPQLEVMSFTPGALLVALVKPMYELGLSRLPTRPSVLEEAVQRAISGIERADWTIRERMRSPLSGTRGAVEFMVCAQRA